MKSRKYPWSLFIIGLLGNVMIRRAWLFVPSLVLMVISVFVEPCLYVGLLVLLLDLGLSLVDQLMLRRTFLEDSDDPNFAEFQDDVSNNDGWINGVKGFVERRINEENNQETNTNDEDSEDK